VFRPILLTLLLLASVRGQEGVVDPQNAEVIEDKVDQIVIEYDAIRASQDLEPARRRRLLARRLGELPHEKSRKLLLRIVQNDGDLRAKIIAMNSLCTIGDLKSIKRMYSYVLKNQRTVLPDYLGPALSLSKDPEIGPWIVKKVLPHANKIMRLSAVEALGTLREPVAREPLLALHEKLHKKRKKVIHLYYETVRALAQIGGEGVKPILHAVAQDEDWRIRLAAADVMPIHFRDPATVALMRKLLKDEKPIVREVAAITTGNLKLEPLFGELVLLMREGNLRAKHKSYIAMTQISGQDYKYAPDAWDKWWRDKKAGKLDTSGAIKAKESMSLATYYNFKIFSDRILFVIDVSGSMNWPEYHPNRIEVATRELIKAIKSLDEKTLFNVMTFAGHVNMWQKKGEVPANERNVAAALKWLKNALLPRGATNTYDALMRSLEDNPLVDTVFFLSDGIPSTGRFELPEQILIKLRYENRFRRVIFNTVALAMGKASIEKAQKYEDPDEMAAFMRMISDMTGGTCLDIRKPFLDR